jgi:hypothetical protein
VRKRCRKKKKKEISCFETGNSDLPSIVLSFCSSTSFSRNLSANSSNFAGALSRTFFVLFVELVMSTSKVVKREEEERKTDKDYLKDDTENNPKEVAFLSICFPQFHCCLMLGKGNKTTKKK